MLVAGLDIGSADGGAERSGVDLCLHLDRTRYAPTLCAFWRTGSVMESSYVQQLERAGVPLVFATPPGARRNSPDARDGLSFIRALVLRGPYALAHAHHEGGALGLALARLSGARCRVLRSTHMPLDLEWGIGWPARLQRAVFSKCLFPAVLDAEVAIAPWYALALNARVVTRARRRPVEMIYNARSVPLVAPRNRGPDQAVRIGMVGRLVDQKRPDLLIEALPAVLAALPGRAVTCVFIGAGELLPALQQRAAALGIAASVQFLGQRDDALAHLQACDLFALPSRWEGLPNVLLEAIGCGVPAIVSDIPGSTDLIQQGATGRVFASGDVAAFAAQIIAAIRDPAGSARMATAAQAHLPAFSAENAALRYQALYASLLSRSERRAIAK